jgi:hypothetical protein
MDEVRHLHTWPCGCREWVVSVMQGALLVDGRSERFEPCPEFKALSSRDRRAELDVAAAYSEHGEHSPEYRRADRIHKDVLARMEEHHQEVGTVELVEDSRTDRPPTTEEYS